MEEAAAADYVWAAAGPAGRAATAQPASLRPHVTRPAGPPRTPSTRAASSPQVRAARGRRGRVSQPPPPRAAAASPRARE
eukprot:4126393-Prymnesium_polylepis.2